jgi:hypothetical protein
MRKIGALAIIVGIVFAFSTCKPSTNSESEESFQKVKKVTPIPGSQNTTMDLQLSDEDSYFTVRLNDGSTMEGWCIEWNKESVRGIQNNVELFSTEGRDEWKKLNYFMSIKDDLLAKDPDLTLLEIQVVIWSLVDNPSFDVDKISEYENIDRRIYSKGKAHFDVQKVKDILKQVDTYFQSKTSFWDYFLIFIRNDGQAIMVDNETAFAYGGDYANCFIDSGEFNRWGWTNGALSEGEYEFDIYTGAGQCDLSKGTLVGKLIVNYSNGTLTVTYGMTETSGFTDELYTLTETHLYVGTDPYPTNEGSGKLTVAPGQYGNQTTHDDVTEYTYEINGLSGEIYIIAHAVVNGFNIVD